MKFSEKNKGGFTLTEIVVSMFLLTIVWLSVVNIIVVSRAAGSLAKHKTQAIYLIQQKIEDMRKTPFSSSAWSNGTYTTYGVMLDTRGTRDITTGDLTGTRIVTISTPSTYYKRIVVEFRWNESLSGKAQQFSEYAGTYIANDSQAN